MSRIKGAVVVRRPDLAKAPAMLGPVNTLDFVKAFQSYFAIFRSSLFPTRQMIEEHYLVEVDKDWLFFQAVANGDSEVARFLSTYHATVEVPKPASDGYENIPTLVGMADVFINKLGYVWNEKDYIVPKSCKSHLFGPRASSILPTSAERHEKVVVIAQYWGDEYYHFLVEALPRITLMLDVLVENLDIKVAVHAPKLGSESHTTFIYELLALLGIDSERVIFIQTEIHADLAILPSSIPCGRPDTQMVNMLRSVLLKAMYPRTQGIPPEVPRPVIVLVVRESRRWLKNNDQVRDALKQDFPDHDIVEFWGNGPIIRQMRLFATASVIVAPHGAGLSNMVVSPLHTPVLEIGSPDCSACYLHLALKVISERRCGKHCPTFHKLGGPRVVQLPPSRLYRWLELGPRYMQSADNT
ncbi:conserved unknown protein [Ectocarpus siliculosus]|uniref:Glycosyltransferase 61 catalytic domain-containing protein n=1 Tax=Ectocarpus siliculosus TaxID=2880 RepID=D7FK32_ECTSI|nr:conserved unknown protein [Ectocarpus siliculosus]|eukprot:CBJ29242.1 conserved unknown protein [Ectocarpus siliculosus]